jgi:NAD-dependent SIR2 family protein deacetylase
VVGTSAVVQPAASLVDLAPAKAIRVVINPERTEHAIGAGYLLQATAGTALPLLVDAAFPDPA